MGGRGQHLLRLRMFLPFSWPMGHVLRGVQMELGEENRNSTWIECYTQTQGVGVLGVHANTNARQGSGGKEFLWHNQLREQRSLHGQGRKP